MLSGKVITASIVAIIWVVIGLGSVLRVDTKMSASKALYTMGAMPIYIIAGFGIWIDASIKLRRRKRGLFRLIFMYFRVIPYISEVITEEVILRENKGLDSKKSKTRGKRVMGILQNSLYTCIATMYP